MRVGPAVVVALLPATAGCLGVPDAVSLDAGDGELADAAPCTTLIDEPFARPSEAWNNYGSPAPTIDDGELRFDPDNGIETGLLTAEAYSLDEIVLTVIEVAPEEGAPYPGIALVELRDDDDHRIAVRRVGDAVTAGRFQGTVPAGDAIELGGALPFRRLRFALGALVAQQSDGEEYAGGTVPDSTGWLTGDVHVAIGAIGASGGDVVRFRGVTLLTCD
jgi:hypothetical protein